MPLKLWAIIGRSTAWYIFFLAINPTNQFQASALPFRRKYNQVDKITDSQVHFVSFTADLLQPVD